jgi:hypothetical protein
MADWNGNGREDAGDWYIDYEIMNDNGGGGGNSDGSGCGCLLLIFVALLFISLF